jgi:uncharacterized protein DUF5659
MNPSIADNSTQTSHNGGESMQIEVYRTADLSLSAFLRALGHRILDVQTERGRGIFVFASSSELRRDIVRWGNGDTVPINVRGVVHSLRDLKGLVAV